MIDFITSHIRIFIAFAIVLLILGFAPTITELPFGLDGVLTVFMQTLNMMSAIDFLQVPLTLFLASIGIEIGFFVWKWIKFFIGLYK